MKALARNRDCSDSSFNRGLAMVFVLHFMSSFMMLGLILVIQWVHYPSFHFIDRDKFVEYSPFHGSRITPIVLPLMTIEIITGIWLCYLESYEGLYLLNACLVVITWLSTFFLSVPIHQKLISGYDSYLVDRLVRTNYPRLIAWVLHCGILFYLVSQKFGVL